MAGLDSSRFRRVRPPSPEARAQESWLSSGVEVSRRHCRRWQNPTRYCLAQGGLGGPPAPVLRHVCEQLPGHHARCTAVGASEGSFDLSDLPAEEALLWQSRTRFGGIAQDWTTNPREAQARLNRVPVRGDQIVELCFGGSRQRAYDSLYEDGFQWPQDVTLPPSSEWHQLLFRHFETAVGPSWLVWQRHLLRTKYLHSSGVQPRYRTSLLPRRGKRCLRHTSTGQSWQHLPWSAMQIGLRCASVAQW